MDIGANVQERPDVTADEQASHEIITRIRKLRWMGMEVEAERMELALRKVNPRETSLAGPRDTDWLGGPASEAEPIG